MPTADPGRDYAAKGVRHPAGNLQATVRRELAQDLDLYPERLRGRVRRYHFDVHGPHASPFRFTDYPSKVGVVKELTPFTGRSPRLRSVRAGPRRPPARSGRS